VDGVQNLNFGVLRRAVGGADGDRHPADRVQFRFIERKVHY
jgi:hypothetical protein